MEYQIEKYLTRSGKCPFDNWFNNLETKSQAIIDARITRLRVGNFGNYKSLGEGVFELKFKYSSGFRVYFGKDGDQLVILLIGGDKKSQSRDIDKAKGYWKDYKKE